MLLLVARMRAAEWTVILATMVVALANWLWVRQRA